MKITNIIPCLLTVITAAQATMPELVTTLDQNMICFLHMYGIRSGARVLGEGYLFGFYDDQEARFVPFVKTVNDNSTALYGPSDLIELTSVSSHAPKYEQDIDYCKQVEELVAEQVANGSVVPNTPNAFKRDQYTCWDQRCINENQCAPHGKKCSDCYMDNKGTFCVWDAGARVHGKTCYYCLGWFAIVRGYCHIAKGLRQCK